MKVLKRFSWSRDGIRTESLVPGELVPSDMPGLMVEQLRAEGYIVGEPAKKAMPVSPENKDLASQIETPEDKDLQTEDKNDISVDEDLDAGETEIPEGYEELEAADMKELALKVTGRKFTTKTAARKAIADVEARKSASL